MKHQRINAVKMSLVQKCIQKPFRIKSPMAIVINLTQYINLTGFSMSIFGPGPEVIKLCSCSTQLSMKFIMLINVKMPTLLVF